MKSGGKGDKKKLSNTFFLNGLGFKTQNGDLHYL